MQTAKVNSLKQYASCPKTQQGYASIFQLSKDGKWLAYVTKNTLILRDMDDLSNSKIFTKHSAEICGFAFSPDGETAASVDIKAICYVWKLNTLNEVKKIENVFGGKINGLDFSEDGTKIIVYGQTKSVYGRVFNWDTVTDCGKIDGISRNVISGAFSSVKPHRILLGDEDGEVHFYEGPPFKHTKKLKEHAGKFVSGIRPTPDGTKFVSVGFDKKIVLYDAKEGTQLDVIDTSKVENGHKMAIISCAFLDNDRLVTASIDRSVKVWNLTEKKLLFTLIPAEGNLKNDFIFCGVQCNAKKIVAVALSGIMYAWNVETLADKKLPDEIWEGHQGPINSLVLAKTTKEIVTFDTTGKVLLWNEAGVPKLLLKSDKPIVKMELSCDESLIYILLNSGVLLIYDRATATLKTKVENLGTGMRGLVASKKNAEEVYVLLSKGVTLVAKGAATKKGTLSFEAKAIDLNEELGEVLVGDNRGVLHVLDMEFKEKSKVNIHQGEFSVIKVSPDNKLIASGNNQNHILVYDAATKEMKCDRFGFHTAKIFDLDWTTDCKYLISCSLDYAVMIWELETRKRLKNYQSIDGAAQNAVKFLNDEKDFVCAGACCTVHQIKFE